MPRVTFVVGRVVGKERPRVLRSGRAYTPARTALSEAEFAAGYRTSCMAKYGTVLTAGPHVPVALSITVLRPLPKGRPKSVSSEPDTYKPDWDNLGKLVSDALNGVAYADDAQVTSASVRKLPRRRGGDEMTIVTVSWGEGASSLAEKEVLQCRTYRRAHVRRPTSRARLCPPRPKERPSS